MYKLIGGFHKFKMFLNKLRLPAVFFWNKFLFLPINDIDLEYHIGKKIQFPTIENPTKEDVEKYH